MLCALLPLPAERVVKVYSVGRGVQIIRIHIEKHGHDPRQVDLVTVIVLVVLVFGAIYYLCGAAANPITTGFIVPNQTVHW
jgi:hypothetical protein